MNGVLTAIFGISGGLALFLYGMNKMSEALQKAAGERMKKILAALTKNPVMGALAGAVVTAALQSSSATTVMTIGFVSAGLMSLPQAISVIFGANIGTTVTAQLIAFKLSDYIYAIIFLGFLIISLAKKERTVQIGNVIFSFGLLFVGIEIMGSVTKPLASGAVFTELMSKVSQSPVSGVLLGSVMTLIVQSSSATIAVLQNVASQPAADGISSVLGLSGAIPILLGDNIGTTITALLASVGQSKNAKRTALAHCLFNITGSVLFLFLLSPLAEFVRLISPKGSETEIISRQIANAHTAFNTACTLIWLPLLPLMVKLVTLIVRDKEPSGKAPSGEAETLKPLYINSSKYGESAASIILASKELEHCAELSSDMFSALNSEFLKEKPERSLNFDEYEAAVKDISSRITNLISKLLAGGKLTGRQSEYSAGLMYAANNIERIAQRCGEIIRLVRSVRASGEDFTPEAAEEISGCLVISGKLFEKAAYSMRKSDLDSEEYRKLYEDILQEREKISDLYKKYSRTHINRMKNKRCAEKPALKYTKILYCIEKIADNCTAISESWN